MAIALEADFRSIKTSQAAESPTRKEGKSGGGEAFASSLARARDADAAEPSDKSPDPSATAAALPFPPPTTEPAITPEAEAAIAVTAQPLGADEAAEILKSEIVVDRQIVREGAEVQAQGAADLKAAADTDAARAQAALATIHSIPEASEISATGTTSNAAATQEAGKMAAQTSVQAADSSRAPVAAPATVPDDSVAAPAIVAAVAGASPASANANAKAPDSQPIQRSEAPADPDAFALMAAGDEQTAARDARLSDTGIAPLTDITGKGTPLDTASLNSTTPTGSQTLAAVSAPAAPQAAGAAPTLIASAPAFAVVTASPAQIVDIIAETADDGQSDRVVVQLDPPELGRVSIDFKFDAQGLQHVTITSETPEAMRQLRQMHSELVQSLERHGIGSENLSFQHQQQGSPQSPPPNPFARAAALGDSGTGNAAIIASTDSIPGARTLPGGRLDIRI